MEYAIKLNLILPLGRPHIPVDNGARLKTTMQEGDRYHRRLHLNSLYITHIQFADIENLGVTRK